ncbi:MAG: hypothetical protein ACI9GW_003492 [Halieaceae bacterium]|jgi:hypothetical protein
MNIDKIAPIVALVIAILASFIALEWWALILVLVGLVHGIMSPVEDSATKAMVIVSALAFPTLADSLDAIPMLGGYLNLIIDNFSIAIAGYAIAALIMDVKARVMG